MDQNETTGATGLGISGTIFCTIGSNDFDRGSSGTIWLTHPMICGAPKVSLHPVAVVCNWWSS